MLRRRRRLLVTSDDDDEDGGDNAPAEFHDPPESPETSPAVLSTVVISDDEFVDVPDELSPPSRSPPAGGTAGCPVQDFLFGLGVRPRREWLDSCLSGLAASRDGFGGLDVGEKAKLCFELFLFSDFNYSSRGGLPTDVHTMHGVELAGPFVLQVDEIVNISGPHKGRYQESPAGLKRCLKLCMTDGAQRIFGMEYCSIKQLDVLSPAGIKICVCNVHIRHGLLMLVPEVVEVLGGSVATLDAARKRLVEEVNKPPRGKRNRREDALSFATRAQLAAWPDANPSHVEMNHFSESSNHQQPRAFRPPFANSAATISRGDHLVRNSENGAEPEICVPTSNLSVNREAISGRISASNIQSIPFSCVAPKNTSCAMELLDERRAREYFSALNQNPAVGPWTSQDRCSMDSMPDAIRNKPISASCQILNYNSSTDMPSFLNGQNLSNIKNVDKLHAATSKSDGEVNPNQDAVFAVFVGTSPGNGQVDARGQSDNSALDKVDVGSFGKAESLTMSRRDEEIPFTYLALLQAKWTSLGGSVNFIRGKIKCFLTGVKGFQFKNRSKYELQVYVDDGSLISEVLIDHEVVKKGIGYSPEEVTAALSSLEKSVSVTMREKMKQYQLFLANFEGTMIVEINRQNKVPIATEMSQGCSSSDFKLLLSRMDFSSAPQAVTHSESNPIELSP